MMDFNRFGQILKDSFPEVTPEQVEKFRAMDGLYRDWNAKINVISRKDIDGLYDHHILHSLAIAKYLKELRPDEYQALSSPDGKITALDLGTGGGFPGIPLAVLLPGVRMTLCDSVGKKILVASEVAKSLGLENVETVNARAESLPGRFDYVFSRAVTSLPDFYRWVKGKYSKSILYLKGGDVNEEISEMMARFKMRKGSVSTWRVDSWLDDSYFEGKFVINIL